MPNNKFLSPLSYGSDDKGIHPACNPKSRQQERDELAELMEKWEQENGPVVTQTIGEFYNPNFITIKYYQKGKIMRNFQPKPIDFQRCLLRACRIRNTNMQKASIKAGKSKAWMRNIAGNNSPSLRSMLTCAKAFDMELVELLTIFDRNYDETSSK